MAWEARLGTKARYYYRSRRVDGRVLKTCYGTGDRATEAARQDAEASAARAADELLARAEQAGYEPLDRLTDELDAGTDLLLESVLLATGHHQHKSQWRRQRHGSHRDKSIER
jgi:hypothetical protein